jgi:hypothetical protein
VSADGVIFSPQDQYQANPRLEKDETGEEGHAVRKHHLESLGGGEQYILKAQVHADKRFEKFSRPKTANIIAPALTQADRSLLAWRNNMAPTTGSGKQKEKAI